MGKYTELFKEMEEFAEQYQVPIISPQGGNLLVEIIKKQKPNRILEIGTAIGYSALLMEANMPCNGNIVTIEQNEERLAVARTFIQKAGAENKIQIIFAGKFHPDDVMGREMFNKILTYQQVLELQMSHIIM